MADGRTKTDLERERRLRFLEKLTPWLEDRLFPAMGLSAGGTKLELPAHGERTMVFLLSAGDREMVVRCFERRSDRVKTERATRHSLRRNVPVPAVLFADGTRATRVRLGFSVLVEERAPGVHSDDYPDRAAMLGITARAVSRMHNVYRSRWGNLRVGRRRGYFERMRGTLEKHLATAARLGSEFAQEQGERIRSWLDARRGRVCRIRRFSYSHKSLASDNVLISSAGEFTFIDVQRLSYEHFAANLLKALWVFPREPGEEETFLMDYFAVAEGRTPEEFGEWRDLFGVFHFVRLLMHTFIAGSRGADVRAGAADIQGKLISILERTR